MKPSAVRKVLAAAAALGLLACVAACGRQPSPPPVDSSPVAPAPTAETAPASSLPAPADSATTETPAPDAPPVSPPAADNPVPTDDPAAPGDDLVPRDDFAGTDDFGDDPIFRVELEGVTYPETDRRGEEPLADLRHIRFHLLVENLTDSPQVFLPWQDMEVSTPGGERWYDTYDFADVSLDGSYLPGLPVRGSVGYQIPADASGVELTVNLEPVIADRDIPVRRNRYVIDPARGPVGEPGSDAVFIPQGGAFRVGDSFQMEDIDFSLRFAVEGVDFPEEGGLGDPPPPGMRLMMVHAAAEVTSGYLENLADMFLEVRTPDGFARQERAFAGTGLDGHFGEDGSFRGTAGFLIPEESSTVYLTAENTFNGFYAIYEIDAGLGRQGTTEGYPQLSTLGVGDSLGNDRVRFTLESVIYFDSTEEMEEGVPDFRVISMYALVESADGRDGFFDGWPVFELCVAEESWCYTPLGLPEGEYSAAEPLRASLDYEIPGDTATVYLRPRPGFFHEFAVFEIDARLGDQGDTDKIPTVPTETTGVLLSAPPPPVQTPAGMRRNGPDQSSIFLSEVTSWCPPAKAVATISRSAGSL